MWRSTVPDDPAWLAAVTAETLETAVRASGPLGRRLAVKGALRPTPPRQDDRRPEAAPNGGRR